MVNKFVYSYLWSIASLEHCKDSQRINLKDNKDGGDEVVNQQELLGVPVDDEGDVTENNKDIHRLCIYHKQCSCESDFFVLT